MTKALHRAGTRSFWRSFTIIPPRATRPDRPFVLRASPTTAETRGRYANYTGTGNTLNANEPFVRRLIRDSLNYWVEVMHVVLLNEPAR
jgi:hypothetical protein